MVQTIEEACEERPEILEKVAEAIVPWYEMNKRSMPWRDDPKPYHVWVSEIMLQQTRIEAVRGYFDRFLLALPRISDLAEVPEDELMKLWEGLGYYNRVRNMQKTAKLLTTKYQGGLPADYEELKKLPGIGNYTAGAIASIAYGIAAPAVDGNVLRVLMRVLGCGEDISKAPLKKKVERILQPIIPDRKAGEFNQGIMELGETICIPNGKPNCEMCPLQAMCIACQEQTTDQLPVKSGPKARRIEEHSIFLAEYNNEILIMRRPQRGLLAGLWQYPMCVKQTTNDWLLRLEKYVDTPKPVEQATHIFSHVEWQMQGYYISLTDEKMKSEVNEILANGEGVWVTLSEQQKNYALPTAFKAYRDWLMLDRV